MTKNLTEFCSNDLVASLNSHYHCALTTSSPELPHAGAQRATSSTEHHIVDLLTTSSPMLLPLHGALRTTSSSKLHYHVVLPSTSSTGHHHPATSSLPYRGNQASSNPLLIIVEKERLPIHYQIPRGIHCSRLWKPPAPEMIIVPTGRYPSRPSSLITVHDVEYHCIIEYSIVMRTACAQRLIIALQELHRPHNIGIVFLSRCFTSHFIKVSRLS